MHPHKHSHAHMHMQIRSLAEEMLCKMPASWGSVGTDFDLSDFSNDPRLDPRLVWSFHILWLVNQCQSINIYRCHLLPDRSLFSSWPMRKNNPGVKLCSVELPNCSNELLQFFPGLRPDELIVERWIHGHQQWTKLWWVVLRRGDFFFGMQKWPINAASLRHGQVSVWQPALLAVRSLSNFLNRLPSWWFIVARWWVSGGWSQTLWPFQHVPQNFEETLIWDWLLS